MDVLKKEEEEKLLKGIDQTERIEKEVSLSWDGKNLLVRFPKEIANYFNVNEKNRSNKKLKFILEENQGEIKTTFNIIDKNEKSK